jgi:hypothetical protein
VSITLGIILEPEPLPGSESDWLLPLVVPLSGFLPMLLLIDSTPHDSRTTVMMPTNEGSTSRSRGRSHETGEESPKQNKPVWRMEANAATSLSAMPSKIYPLVWQDLLLGTDRKELCPSMILLFY